MLAKDILEYIYIHSQSQRRRTKGKELPKIAASLGASAASQRSAKRETRPGRSLLEDRKPVQLNGKSKERKITLLNYGKKLLGLENTCETTTKRDERWKTET